MLEKNYVALDIGETNIKAVAMNEYASKHKVSMTEVALRSLEEYLSKNK